MEISGPAHPNGVRFRQLFILVNFTSVTFGESYNLEHCPKGAMGVVILCIRATAGEPKLGEGGVHIALGYDAWL